MKWGLIGEKLGHSFSKLVHTELTDNPYELCEVSRDSFDEFMTRRDFLGINVTIPYKEEVIPYLDSIDTLALEIGAVNTVINQDGRLFGYNTDAFGLEALIKKTKINLSGATVAILGTGGTSKTARAVAKKLGAKRITTVSRSPKGGAIGYSELYGMAHEIEVIIDTTPVGTFPNTDPSAVDVSRFPNLKGVIDAVYNPLRTSLILSARERCIPASGGLYMLVGQAVRASELFHGVSYSDTVTDTIYEKLHKGLENIVLIGMPSSGKSTVGREVAQALGREFLDTDVLISERAGMEISEIFEKHGEEYFRNLEAKIIKEVSLLSGKIISTGGGAPMFDANEKNLRKNGRLFFLDRPKEKLIPTDDRPLSKSAEKLAKLFSERHPKYTKIADEIIDAKGTVDEVKNLVLEKIK